MPTVFQKLCTWLSNSPSVGDPAVNLTAAVNRCAALDSLLQLWSIKSWTADCILNDLIKK